MAADTFVTNGQGHFNCNSSLSCLTRSIEKKVSLLLLCDDYVSIIADGNKDSTFLCTQKLGLEEVSVSLITV